MYINNLDEPNNINNDMLGRAPSNDLLISEIRANDIQTSSEKGDGPDNDIEEMEKLLKSGGGFGGGKGFGNKGGGLSETFKKIKGELQQDGEFPSSQKSGLESDDLGMNDNGSSPGQNTLVMNQIN